MADYNAVNEGEQFTLTAGATIVGGQLVKISAANTVIPTAAHADPAIGVAAFDAASGTPVTILSLDSVHSTLIKSGVVVVAGTSLLTAEASGQVGLYVAGTDPTAGLLGPAFTSGTGDGTTVAATWRHQ